MLTRRIHYAPLALLLLLASCASLKQIPLFNPEASLINRIYSAKEVLAEVNGQVADAVASGLLTQDDANKHWGPPLDSAKLTIERADELRIAGDTAGANGRLNAAKTVITALRSELIRMRNKGR